MNIRQEAIKKLLDEGADITDENINAVAATIEPARTGSHDIDKAINTMMSGQRQTERKLNELIGAIGDLQDRPINVPEIKIPDIKLPDINMPASAPAQNEPRTRNFNIVRDANGNIINLQVEEK